MKGNGMSEIAPQRGERELASWFLCLEVFTSPSPYPPPSGGNLTGGLRGGFQ